MDSPVIGYIISHGKSSSRPFVIKPVLFAKKNKKILCNQSVALIFAIEWLQIYKMRRDPFQAIADPTRRAILALLALQAMTPNALAAHFNSSRQAVSKHIRILVDCDLVRQEQSGREIRYHFSPEKIREVDVWLEQFRKLWEQRYAQLDQVLHNLKNKENE